MIAKTAKTILATISILAGATGVITATNSADTAEKPSSSQYEAPVVERHVETIEEQKTSEIPFETITQDDNTLASGSTKVVTEGVNGEKLTTYEVVYTDGIETSRKVKSTETLREPITKVIANGTYVKPAPAPQPTGCSNGTYVNSAGNTVCRPSSDNTGGATAICKDGTYSYSQSRRGTCSSHGGVRQWL